MEKNVIIKYRIIGTIDLMKCRKIVKNDTIKYRIMIRNKL